MIKRKYEEIQDKLLMILREEPMTYAKLERKMNTGFRTVKMHVENLEKLGILKIDTIDEHPSNGRKSYKVSITTLGRKNIKK
jgi:DNA-binding Lrp family transcriptional regulator